MALGLDPDEELVMRWRWLPLPPLPLDMALPAVTFGDDASFRAGAPDPARWAAYRFSFAQLAKQTPDLHFYRLVQLFNTPLATVTTRAAGRSGYAHWGGKPQLVPEEHRVAHLWFFHDETDADLVVLEYSFAGAFTLRSQTKSPDRLRVLYAEICRRVNAP